MHSKQVTILLVEDNPGDARLIYEMLSEARASHCTLETADRLSEAISRCTEGGIDGVLLDLTLPDSRGLDTLAALQAEAPDIPIVVLTGLDDEMCGVQAVQRGAQDYLVKGQVDSNLLVRAIHYAIERKHALLRLQMAHEELEKGNRFKGEIIQNVSHEFRTPLSYLMGYLWLILDEAEDIGPLTDVQREYLKMVARQAEKLLGLVENFGAMLPAEAIAKSAALTGTNDMLAQAVDGIRIRAAEARINLSLQAPDLPPVVVNRGAIAQVLDNLLTNALKFTPPGGEVAVRAWLDSESGKVNVSVADTGIGIPEEAHQHIFERFYQVDGSTTRKHDGVGLGLAVCKEIVEAHRERIWVESAPGEGATFTFSLPAAGDNFQFGVSRKQPSARADRTRARTY